MPRSPRARRGAPSLESNVAELRALAHPIRLRLLELFAEAPRTTKQVAALLGAPPTRLYHHVAALERAGLLQVHESRKVRGTIERWYAAAPQRSFGTAPPGVEPARSAKTKAARGPSRAVALTVLEQARRELAAAPRHGIALAPLVARLVLRVPPARIPELRKRIYDAIREATSDCTPADGAARDASADARWALTLAFAPVWPRAGSED
jgi:DNA-binding transcriptional ArsR family regulator